MDTGLPIKCLFGYAEEDMAASETRGVADVSRR